MGDIERRRNEADVPAGQVRPVVPAGTGAPAERFVRVVEQIAIDAARREPGVTPQNPAGPAPTVIYINNASGPAQAAPPAPPPTEVHYHTTVHQNARGASSSRALRKGTSTFGLAAVMFGIVSCVACWTSVAQSVAFPVGVLGVALGALGWLTAVLLGRTGAAMPFAGMLLSALGLFISVVGREAAQPILDELKSKAQDVVNEGRNLLPTGKGPGEGAVEPKPPTSAIKTAVPGRDVVVNGANPPPANPDVAKVDLEKVKEAKAKLAGAITAVEARLALDPSYQTARAVANEADVGVTELRNAGKSGTPEMALAVTRALDARSRVRKLYDPAIDSDPDVRSAKATLEQVIKRAP